MAILAFIKTISGLPGSVLTFTRYLIPFAHNARRSAISGLVFLDLTADIILCVTSGVRAIATTTLFATKTRFDGNSGERGFNMFFIAVRYTRANISKL
jgi:hypothetical protein